MKSFYSSLRGLNNKPHRVAVLVQPSQYVVAQVNPRYAANGAKALAFVAGARALCASVRCIQNFVINAARKFLSIIISNS